MTFRKLSAFGFAFVVSVLHFALLGSNVVGQEAKPEKPRFAELFGGAAGGGGTGELVTVSAKLTYDASNRAGRLEVTAKIASGWHLYSVTQKPGGPQKTKITLLPTDQFTIAEQFKPDVQPLVSRSDIFPGVDVEEHDGQVIWTTSLLVAEGNDPLASKPKLKFSGLVCKDACSPVNQTIEVEVVAGKVAAPTISAPPSQTEPQDDPKTSTQKKTNPSNAPIAGGFDPSKLVLENVDSQMSLGWILVVAFAGGFILNFMPCVLPVIGLKIMSFVQQAGQSRHRVFLLNVWYCLGLLAVFMVLATLVVVMDFGWGMQNQSTGFSIAMLSLVFAMALSFLGVWEIPIPGFVGSGAAADIAEKEGPFGAFFKGIVTTVLAVPCSGPGVATAFAWTNGKPAFMVYAVFVCMALGMASPYLLIGANPSLVRFLPKPGMWMETFKELLGFVLLGTVVFMLTTIPLTDVVPTVALMFAIWAACWWGGRTPFTAPASRKMFGWVSACLFAALIGWFSFTSFRGIMEERFMNAAANAKSEALKKREGLHWNPYTLASLQQLTADRKTVVVDFTADWCATCKTLEAFVLNTPEIREALAEHKVETMVADWTRSDEEVTQMLNWLGSKQIPVLAIFPGDRPNNPIVLRGWYDKSTLKQKLAEASSSQTKTAAGVAAR